MTRAKIPWMLLTAAALIVAALGLRWYQDIRLRSPSPVWPSGLNVRFLAYSDDISRFDGSRRILGELQPPRARDMPAGVSKIVQVLFPDWFQFVKEVDFGSSFMLLAVDGDEDDYPVTYVLIVRAGREARRTIYSKSNNRVAGESSGRLPYLWVADTPFGTAISESVGCMYDLKHAGTQPRPSMGFDLLLRASPLNRRALDSPEIAGGVDAERGTPIRIEVAWNGPNLQPGPIRMSDGFDCAAISLCTPAPENLAALLAHLSSLFPVKNLLKNTFAGEPFNYFDPGSIFVTLDQGTWGETDVALLSTDTTAGVALPVLGAAIVAPGAQKHPLSPWVAALPQIPFQWGASLGSLSPLWSEQVAFCLTRTHAAWLATSQEAAMGPLVARAQPANAVHAPALLTVNVQSLGNIFGEFNRPTAVNDACVRRYFGITFGLDPMRRDLAYEEQLHSDSAWWLERLAPSLPSTIRLEAAFDGEGKILVLRGQLGSGSQR